MCLEKPVEERIGDNLKTGSLASDWLLGQDKSSSGCPVSLWCQLLVCSTYRDPDHPYISCPYTRSHTIRLTMTVLLQLFSCCFHCSPFLFLILWLAKLEKTVSHANHSFPSRQKPQCAAKALSTVCAHELQLLEAFLWGQGACGRSTQSHDSQSVVPRPAAGAASPEHLLEMPAILPYSRQTESETRGVSCILTR